MTYFLFFCKTKHDATFVERIYILFKKEFPLCLRKGSIKKLGIDCQSLGSVLKIHSRNTRVVCCRKLIWKILIRSILMFVLFLFLLHKLNIIDLFRKMRQWCTFHVLSRTLGFKIIIVIFLNVPLVYWLADQVDIKFFRVFLFAVLLSCVIYFHSCRLRRYERGDN